MKKDDEILKGRTDDEEDLFDLSLDDLEPEDTIVEAHVDEADEEIIELIDLVEKGDIDLGEEDKDSGLFLDTIQEAGDGLKADETLDLLSVPLDQAFELDQLEGFGEGDKAADAVEISDSDLFLEVEPEKPSETIQPKEMIFDDIADDSALNELLADEETALKEEEEMEGLTGAGIEGPETLPPIGKDEKTIRIYPEEAESPKTVTEIQPEIIMAEEMPAVEGHAAPVKEQAEEMPSPAETAPIAISEERIEAIIRKVVEEVVERVAREAMAGAGERILKDANEMVERIARETTASIAEKVITDAINILKNSIESASE